MSVKQLTNLPIVIITVVNYLCVQSLAVIVNA